MTCTCSWNKEPCYHEHLIMQHFWGILQCSHSAGLTANPVALLGQAPGGEPDPQQGKQEPDVCRSRCVHLAWEVRRPQNSVLETHPQRYWALLTPQPIAFLRDSPDAEQRHFSRIFLIRYLFLLKHKQWSVPIPFHTVTLNVNARAWGSGGRAFPLSQNSVAQMSPHVCRPCWSCDILSEGIQDSQSSLLQAESMNWSVQSYWTMVFICFLFKKQCLNICNSELNSEVVDAASAIAANSQALHFV